MPDDIPGFRHVHESARISDSLSPVERFLSSTNDEKQFRALLDESADYFGGISASTIEPRLITSARIRALLEDKRYMPLDSAGRLVFALKKVALEGLLANEADKETVFELLTEPLECFLECLTICREPSTAGSESVPTPNVVPGFIRTAEQKKPKISVIDMLSTRSVPEKQEKSSGTSSRPAEIPQVQGAVTENKTDAQSSSSFQSDVLPDSELRLPVRETTRPSRIPDVPSDGHPATEVLGKLPLGRHRAILEQFVSQSGNDFNTYPWTGLNADVVRETMTYMAAKGANIKTLNSLMCALERLTSALVRSGFMSEYTAEEIATVSPPPKFPTLAEEIRLRRLISRLLRLAGLDEAMMNRLSRSQIDFRLGTVRTPAADGTVFLFRLSRNARTQLRHWADYWVPPDEDLLFGDEGILPERLTQLL